MLMPPLLLLLPLLPLPLLTVWCKPGWVKNL
jgi:hypothetical protein